MAGYRVYLCGVDERTKVPYPECPNATEHTPSPRGYLEWHEWAEEMAKTHVQRECGSCGHWVIHVPRQSRLVSEESS